MNLAVVGQLITLIADTVQRILARKAAKQQLDQGQRLRGALDQTGQSTKIYDEIILEAQQQMNEEDAAVSANLKVIDGLVAQLKAAAKE